MKNRTTLALVLLALFASGVFFLHRRGSTAMYKAPKKIPVKFENHGDVRVDDYYWMRERDTRDVLDFLHQENTRTEEALKPVAGLQDKLYKEMRARIKEDDASVPEKIDDWWYYRRYQAGQEYPVHCRRHNTMDAPEEVFLDENELAKGHDYFDLADFEISPDHRYVAFSVDTVGRRIYDIRIKDLSTGKILDDKIAETVPGIAWAKDNKTLFFVRQDLETLRPYQAYRYELGSNTPVMFFEEPDTTYNIGIGASKSNDHILLAIVKRDSTEWRVLDADKPAGAWWILQKRENNHEYTAVEAGDRFYILTNWNAKNFRLMEAPLTSTSKAEWKEVVAHNPAVLLESVDAFAGHIVISQRQGGLPQLRVRDRKNGTERVLGFPDAAYEVSAMELHDYHSKVFRFAYESLVQPPSVYDEEFASAKRELKKQRQVPGYKHELYETARLWAKAKDGAMVPISVVYRKDIKKDGSHPLLLDGYGSYGLNQTPNFYSPVFSLIDRGFVYALPHIRGGSEMGRDWYEQGRLKHKMNTFTDFIACAEKLIAEGFTSKDHLHITGGSAGGLLMGAVMNMRPDLFKSMVAAVPFVDVLTTMLDESIPLTTGEYNEWGDPRKKDEYMYMRQYSPYDNVEKKAYPHLFVTTGYHDSQVQYWEPAKWVAKLRESKTDPNLLLLYTEFEAGHSGASGRFEALKLLAKQFAFILMVEGIKE